MTYDDTNARGQGSTSEKIAADAKNTLANASTQAKEQAKQKIDTNKQTAASELETVAHAVRAAASDLRDNNHEGLSGYVSEIANSVSTLADGIRSKSVDELFRDIETIARRNPTLFLAGSLAIGLGVARFAKASSRRQYQSEDMNRADYNYDYDATSAGAYSSGYTSSGVTGNAYSSDDFSSQNSYPAGGYGATTSTSPYTSSESSTEFGAGSVDDEDYSADDYAAADLNDETLESGDDTYSTSGFGSTDRNKSTSEASVSSTKNNSTIGGKGYER